jgi:hypothetical protein
MGLKETLERLRVLFDGTSLDSPLPPPFPPAAVEIGPERISGVRVVRDRRAKRMVVKAAAWRDLPEGAVEASLTRLNVRDDAAVGTALDEVLKAVAPGEHKVSLLIPDAAARVSILTFPVLPGTRRELEDLVRFRMTKALPFKADEAAMDLLPLGAPVGAGATPGAGAVMAVFLHRPILEQYETLLTTRGYWPGLVGLSTLELFNLYRSLLGANAAQERDLMLLNLTHRDLSLLIASAGKVIFYRCKNLPVGEGGLPEIQSVRREIYTSLAFYQEKLLGRGLARVWLRTAGMDPQPVADAVREEAGTAVEVLSLSQVLHLGEAMGLHESGAALLAPAAGAVAGRRA